MTTPPEVPIPRYGTAALADLVPSLLAGHGVPDCADVLRLAGPDRVCLLLVDGLGDLLLREHAAAHAPFLAGLLSTSWTLTAGFPSTTATSLSSIGTGLVPGQHGLLGYRVAVPGTDQVLNELRWSKDIDPLAWQPKRTAFERAEQAGVRVHQVGPSAFRGSGFTEAGLRGARYEPAESAGAVVARAVEVLARPGPVLVYAYYSELDLTGHLYGSRSAAWQHELGQVDRLVEQLADSLPAGSTLLVTGDHGMVDVAPADRLDVETDAELSAGVRLLAGESRARMVYAQPGAEADVLDTWQARLGDRAWVRSREQVIDEGWYGTVDAGLVDRIGDVIAAAFGPLAMTATRSERMEAGLLGMHGSLTAEEQLVPLLRVDRR